LSRGYAIVTREEESTPLRETARLARGDRLAIRFARGEARAVVEEIITAPAEGKTLD
jgi:exonuclease VII large subunit